MPEFVYEAVSREGAIVKGTGTFNSEEELFYTLQRDGLLLVKYSIKKLPSLRLLPSKIKRKELAEFLHHLSFMLRSGIPLVSALEDLEKETKNARFKKVISQIKSEILRGESFRGAIEKSKVFPPVVLSLIQIGEQSGTLDKTLEEASQHLYRIDEIISQVKRAMIYPAFLLLAMSGAFGFWIFYVLPKLLSTFKEMGVKLPLATVLLMQVVDFFMKIKLFLPVGIIGFVILTIFLYRFPLTQIPFEKFLLKIPIFGRIRRLNFLAFFFEHFALLLSAGIDLLRVFNLMVDSFPRLYFKKIVKNLEEAVLSGETIANAMRKEKIFRPLDIRMLSVGESTGRLEEQLRMLAGFYYQEVENLVNTLTKLLEPLILVIAGIIFLIILLALIGPIYELISAVGKG